MSFTRLVASKYLASRHKLSWITLLSITGITIGVAAMITVISVINGFEYELRERFLAANAHILAFNFPGGVHYPETIRKSMLSEYGHHLKGVAPFVYGETMGKKDSIAHAMLIKGIHPRFRKNVQDIEKFVKPTSGLAELQKEIDHFEKTGELPSKPKIILGKGIAKLLGLKVGDNMTLLVPPQTAKPRSPIPSQYRIVAIYDSGLHHYDSKLGLLSTTAGQQLFDLGNLMTGLEIGLKDPNSSPEVAEQLGRFYRHLTIKEWQSYNKTVFKAMKSERAVISFIVALVAFVASFNIFTTLFITVTQKQRDISILKAIGASNTQVLSIFVKQSTMIGVIGSLLGLALGFGLCVFIANYKLKLPEIYSLESLPIMHDFHMYYIIAIVNVIISAIAGLYPAWTATRVTPVQGIARGAGS